MRRSARRFQQLARQRLPATRPVFPPAAAEAAAPLVDTRATDPLVDAHGRRHTYLRVSLTETCNFACRYCVPEEGAEPGGTPALTAEEVLRAVGILVRAGVNKVRLTGGEPTVRRDLASIVAGLGALRPQLTDVGITTNGLLLDRSLSMFETYGCTQLNVSLDTLVPAKFVLLSRRPSKWYDRVWRNVMAIAENPRFELKLNCVVMRGFNEDEIVDFLDLARKYPIEVRFLEFMPFDGNSWCEDRLVTLAEVFSSMRAAEENLRPVPTSSSNTAKLFDAPGWRGRVGLISPMTDSFCGGCNRLRLTADGSLKNCLFGEEEWSLREMLKEGASDDEILDKVQDAVRAKHYAHGGYAGPADLQDRAAAGANRSMIRIGG